MSCSTAQLKLTDDDRIKEADQGSFTKCEALQRDVLLKPEERNERRPQTGMSGIDTDCPKHADEAKAIQSIGHSSSVREC